MIIIESKNKNYTGITANIPFENGTAKVDNLSDDLRNWFKELGCKVEEIKDEKKTKTKAKLEKGE